jgi:hypothetical protein
MAVYVAPVTNREVMNRLDVLRQQLEIVLDGVKMQMQSLQTVQEDERFSSPAVADTITSLTIGLQSAASNMGALWKKTRG